MDQSDLDLAHRLADAAGAAIRPYFRRLDAIETKADLSPVTAADRAAEAAIRAILARERPEDGIIGEEYGEDRPDARRVWVLDPIDGTRAFVVGRPLFGTLIALIEDGAPVLGIIDQCIARDRWAGATGQPTTLNGAAVRTRPCLTLGAARVGTTSPYLFDGTGLDAFQRVRAASADVIYGGDCHNYGLVAAGLLDLVVESGLKLYDYAALVPVVTGAGGVMCDWSGAALGQRSDGRVIAAGDASVLPELLALLD